MSTTLTNGLKLPDKGSVDWYADMQSNYTILDGAVGTVAEHTSALLGKAPLVHTHTKSDVTDLFNSANTWTGDNTYTKYQNIVINGTEIGVAPNAQNRNGLLFKDKNGVNIGWLRHQYDTSGDISIEMLVSNKYKNGALDPTGTQAYQGVKQTITSTGVSYFSWSGYVNNSVNPYTTETFNIGDSTHQWNNLYAKNYYYNGTEFQSKFVTTDTVQTVNGVKTFTAYVGSIGSSTGDEYSSNTRTNLWLMGNRDTEEVSGILFDTYRQNTAQGTGIHILGIGIKENSVRYEGCRWGWYWDNNLNGYTFDFKPTTQGANQAVKHNLGTSTDKWDTLNGLNPGALSLPSSHYVSIDTTGWDLTGATYNRVYINNANPTFPGILFIRINSSDPVSILVKFFSTSGSEVAYGGSKMEAGSNNMIATVPCPPNTNIYVQIETTSTITVCRYYTLLGDPEFNSRSSS